MAMDLGEPTFVAIVGDRVRCVETGHEMPAFEKDRYASTKKCRDALFDRALAEARPPLNFFQQNPAYKDKLICKLTGDVVNKSEKAVWKHVLGKTFNKKLSAQEEAKTSRDSEKQVDSEEHKVEDEASGDDREMDFWIPPEADASDGELEMEVEKKEKTKKNKKKQDGDKEDNTKPSKKEAVKSKKQEKLKKIKTQADQTAADEEKPHRVRMENKEKQAKPGKKAAKRKENKPSRENGDDENEARIQMKRLAVAVGPSSFASRKKKRKTES